MTRGPLYPSWMRALGVDYGQRRIGLALSDASGLLARPWKTIPRVGNPSQVAQAIAGELSALERDDEAVGVIVVGHPRRLNGEPNDQTAGVEAVAGHLRRLVTIPLVLQDERLTSREAESLLARGEKDWRKRKAQLDAMSAAVILQDYLDSVASSRPPTEDTDA
jgi:putative holliday junction resolvase